MHYRKLFPSNYIGEFDLDGKEHTLTIESVERAEVYVPGSGKEEPKVIMTFKEAAKHWVCNRTNADRIAEMYGNDTENWIGKLITLMPTEVKAFGEITPCVRVKPSEPKLKKEKN